MSTVTSSKLRLVGQRPRFVPAAAIKPASHFLPVPSVQENYKLPAPFNAEQYPKGILYRDGWLKWFDVVKGFGYLHTYDEVQRQQVDIYLHAAEFIQFHVRVGEDDLMTTVFIDGSYLPKIQDMGADGSPIKVTPLPDLSLKEGMELQYIHANNPKRGPYACRWFPVESLRAANEYADSWFRNLQQSYGNLPRYSLFIEDRLTDDAETPWEQLGPTAYHSELWFETNHLPHLLNEWNALKQPLNWLWQRLVVIMERVQSNGVSETEVAYSLDELLALSKQWGVQT